MRTRFKGLGAALSKSAESSLPGWQFLLHQSCVCALSKSLLQELSPPCSLLSSSPRSLFLLQDLFSVTNTVAHDLHSCPLPPDPEGPQSSALSWLSDPEKATDSSQTHSQTLGI